MWRALLARRVALLALAISVAVGVSIWRAGSPPAEGYQQTPLAPIDGPVVRANLIAHLQSRGLAVDPLDLRIVASGDGPAGAGRPFAGWFSAGRAPADLFLIRGRISSAGVPVALSAPRNISRTPDGHELLLDADGDRVLFAVRIGERIPSVTLLDFGRSWLPPEASLPVQLAAALDARQAFGTWDGPQRLDVRLARPTALVVGRLDGPGLVLETDVEVIAVDGRSGLADPADAADGMLGGSPGQDALGLVADILRRSDVVGTRRVLAIEGAAFALTDWLRWQRHRLFPTAADRLPVAAFVDEAPPDGVWPPTDVGADASGLPGEGRWQPVETQTGGGQPSAVQTFIRVDPERPFERVHLFAFDMRRLGLHFVAGTRHPRSATGVRGSGRIDHQHRARVVAAFNGGFKAEHGDFGAIERGRPLIQPRPGLATVVTDDAGRVGFGRWDADTLPPPWTALRQNQAPLIADGVVGPRAVRHWGNRVSDLDAARTARSALGVTAGGALIYGWAHAISAERLGEALQRAGVVFAVHLDMSPGNTGLELYRPEAGGALEAVRGAPGMASSPGRWLGADARDFFYLVRADRRPPDLVLSEPAPGEGQWRPIQRLDGSVAVASTWIAGDRVGGARQLPLLLLEADRLRPHVVPGLAEIRPATDAVPDGLNLPGPPALWIDVGLRGEISPYGLIVGGRPWRDPQPGLMTLAVAADGTLRIGRYGREVSAADPWLDLIQGPALLAGGQLAEGAQGQGTTPISAIGRRADGRLVHIAGLDGDRRAVARGLQLAGAVDGLLLGERGTVDTGSHRIYVARGQRLWMAGPPTGALQPARLAAGAGSALAFTARRAPPAARVLSTFAPAEPAPAP